jgi:hypothetical protein
MNILKRGVRFISQDTGEPMVEDELPLVVNNLTPAGMRRAAIVGVCQMCREGYSVNGLLELLGDKPKEKQ